MIKLFMLFYSIFAYASLLFMIISTIYYFYYCFKNDDV